MGSEEPLNPPQGKTLCEIFMEERGHILDGNQSGKAVPGETGEGSDGLVSVKPIRRASPKGNPSKDFRHIILEEG